MILSSWQGVIYDDLLWFLIWMQLDSTRYESVGQSFEDYSWLKLNEAGRQEDKP